MGRTSRVAPGGVIHHVLNRSVAKIKIFRTDGDFQAFERVMLEAHERYPIGILCYCIMPTHWHFVVYPQSDEQITQFFRWLTHAHVMRWRVAHETVGFGPLYRGRFKSFPMQSDEHLLTVCRYVERNALSAGLVERAQDWRWSSLWARDNGPDRIKALLSPWPTTRRAGWVEHVNEPLTGKESDAMTASIQRGRPYGTERWIAQTAERLNLGHTLRSSGRPRGDAKTGT